MKQNANANEPLYQYAIPKLAVFVFCVHVGKFEA